MDMKDVFRKQGRSEGFIECLEHLERIEALVQTLPDNEAEAMRSYVRNTYKAAQSPSTNSVSLDADELDALLGNGDRQP